MTPEQFAHLHRYQYASQSRPDLSKCYHKFYFYINVMSELTSKDYSHLLWFSLPLIKHEQFLFEWTSFILGSYLLPYFYNSIKSVQNFVPNCFRIFARKMFLERKFAVAESCFSLHFITSQTSKNFGNLNLVKVKIKSFEPISC